MATVWPLPVWALRAAVTVMAALALLEGTEDLALRNGEGRGALQGLWRKGGEQSTEGGPGRRPGRGAPPRSEASSCPVGVRWKESMVVASGACPRERWMSRGGTPASSRGVA
jgi:hypothetical protein